MTPAPHLPSTASLGLAALCLALGSAFAQPALPPAALPPNLEPIPEGAGDAELEPQVTISRRNGQTFEEARVNGRLVWIKVTPAHGTSYYLIPDGNEYTFIRRDSLDSGLKVPLWVLFTF